MQSLESGVHVFATPEALFPALADAVAAWAKATVSEGRAFSWALAGGHTPEGLYRDLAKRYGAEDFWAEVEFYFGDERFVPQNDPGSNYLMARKAFLDRLNADPSRVHPIPTQGTPEEAAQRYEQTLRRKFPGPWPRFDLVLLGLGPDGHTASIFPGSETVGVRDRWVVPSQAPVEPRQRITMTFPVLNQARRVAFLVTGEAKAAALQRILTGAAAVRECPAGGVRPFSGALSWWLDAEAASLWQRGKKA